MKKIILSVSLFVGILAFSGIAYADAMNPAQKLSDLTGKSTESLYAEKADRTFGALASEAGVLEEFRAGMWELKAAVIANRVETGKLTQERADEITQAMLDKHALCDGTGYLGDAPQYGVGYGQAEAQKQLQKQELNNHKQLSKGSAKNKSL